MLISCGHSSESVMNYTPKQVQTFLYFANLRKKQEAAEALSLSTLASRGDPKQIKKVHQDLMKD